MANYICVSVLLCLLLGVVWERSNWLNFFVKTLFLGVGAWGVFNYLRVVGYIVHK